MPSSIERIFSGIDLRVCACARGDTSAAKSGEEREDVRSSISVHMASRGTAGRACGLRALPSVDEQHDPR